MCKYTKISCQDYGPLRTVTEFYDKHKTRELAEKDEDDRYNHVTCHVFKEHGVDEEIVNWTDGKNNCMKRHEKERRERSTRELGNIYADC